MTKYEALQEMEAAVTLSLEPIQTKAGLQLCPDIELAHSNADVILCEFLTSLGHEDLVRLYDEVQKWYA